MSLILELLDDIITIITVRMPFAIVTLAYCHLCHAMDSGSATAPSTFVQHYAAVLSVNEVSIL